MEYMPTSSREAPVQPVGFHCLYDFYGCSPAILNSLDEIVAMATQAAKLAKCEVVGQCSHQFSPHGVTVVLLLAESHLSVHTWPEYGLATVDLFTCGTNVEPELARDCLQQSLQASRCVEKVIERPQSKQ